MAKLKQRDVFDAELASQKVLAKQQLNETLASVTHDLKTPLAMIAGYAESLMDGMEDKPYAELIRKRALEMNDMVLNIIDVSKTTSAGVQNNKIRVPLRKYLSESIEKALAVAKEKGIDCKVGKIPDRYAYIVPQAFDSVIANIVSNAAKHTEKDGKIKIWFRRTANTFTMCVKDNGCGIKSADLTRVFDMYFTEDKARTNGSSGIGLAYVKKIVEEHNGKIVVKSKEGKGAAFYITIPCVTKRAIDRLVGHAEMRKNNKWAAFWLCVFCGFFGAHKLYEGKAGLSLLYTFTGGIFVFGWLFDVVRYLFKSNPYYTKVC